MGKILILICFLTSLPTYSQLNKIRKMHPIDMKLCPEGTYSTSRLYEGDSTNVSITVAAFYMSNEITNKEFREFYLDVKSNPEHSFYIVDMKKAAKKVVDNDSKNVNNFVKQYKYADVLPSLMDTSIYPAINYLFDEKYDDYPVVGVKYDGARFYCVWRTNIENTDLKEKGKPTNHNYRLPLESEWEYAALFSDSDCLGVDSELEEIDLGAKNKLGLYNLCDNVSEWVADVSFEDSKIINIVRGGSWKTTSGFKSKELRENGSTTEYIGFRIVKSAMKTK